MFNLRSVDSEEELTGGLLANSAWRKEKAYGGGFLGMSEDTLSSAIDGVWDTFAGGETT